MPGEVRPVGCPLPQWPAYLASLNVDSPLCGCDIVVRWTEASNNASLLACLAQRVEILMDDATQELLVQNMNLVMGKTEVDLSLTLSPKLHAPC